MKTVIALDAMGGDNAPKAVVEGAVLAVEKMDVAIKLVGNKDVIAPLLAATTKSPHLSILHAPEVIGTDEIPTTAIRHKKQSSIMIGLKTVKEGFAAGFVSAGNTGALLAAATVVVGRQPGIERPALGVLLPNRKPSGEPGATLLIDCGANMDCKPLYLAQFAKLGADYLTKVRGLKNPTVGLINVGVEREKGNTLAKEAYELLETADVNFIGNVEALEIPAGAVDVAVCDAFVGNVVLKYTEGFAKNFMYMLKDELTADVRSKIGALISKKAFGRMRQRFNQDEVGGAPFLGLKHLVVKAHGNSNAVAICNAIRQCVLFEQAEQG
ncbi:MAG: phosphate acyltransferase PlsX [Defluviitaleaceae bacterium]|nr:phosphate acyltransferase PlsX [Defluviitaleaceae bacterium]